MRFLFLVPLLLSACAAPTPVAQPTPVVQPTPNIGATVQAQVRATLTAVPIPTVSATPTAAAIRFKVGANALIGSAAPKSTFIGIDDRAVADYFKAVQANDAVGVLDLEVKNRGFTVSPGIKVLVLDTAYNGDLVRVRILEGPKAPKDGWLPEEWLDPSVN